MTELKPCPFCGHEATIKEDSTCMSEVYVYVSCTHCQAETKLVYQRGNDPMVAYREAIDKWNRRASESEDSGNE